MKILNGAVTAYSMPEDGAEAQSAFLAVLHSPEDTYLEDYGFALKELYDEIKKADDAGVVVHIMIDHLQACGHTEKPMVKELSEYLKHGDITITTAGPEAQKSSEIAHRKRIMDLAGNVALGSVNASHDGFFSQTNDMISFNDIEYVKSAIERFKVRQAWARVHLKEAQVMLLKELH